MTIRARCPASHSTRTQASRPSRSRTQGSVSALIRAKGRRMRRALRPARSAARSARSGVSRPCSSGSPAFNASAEAGRSSIWARITRQPSSGSSRAVALGVMLQRPNASSVSLASLTAAAAGATLRAPSTIVSSGAPASRRDVSSDGAGADASLTRPAASCRPAAGCCGAARSRAPRRIACVIGRDLRHSVGHEP